ncbi:MAG: SDR family NAD(P)-dependent oxidoreductase [Edaphobacter sp.]|uniref:SDR family NAD(P)-dependent oxidoreductase n=1 Tax=Edaphobacter sp. TaxID=1934404 RepID=UPI00239BDD00|nr:SDR family NAD(P)-dependent oxidoreductase [Edaphobacter sp.]MDE1175850.1 SDR family NAD(P)-dependent oxidoreductase [Edaphobacter sp.]
MSFRRHQHSPTPPHMHYPVIQQPMSFATYPSLRDRIVLITGGATGIGAALVEAFAQQHARVAFLDIDQDAGIALVERLATANLPQPLFLACDLTDIDALRAAIATAEQRLGGLDVLVNNAANDQRHTLEDLTPEAFDQGIAVNLRHQLFAVQAVAPVMKAANRGSIINMSSISWIIPSTGLPVYIAAKAAIVGLTRTLAHELGPHNIRVNAVLPGAILTEKQQRLWLTDDYKREILARQALKRHLDPEDVARLVLFLAADDSSAITNQSHVIDGGWV